MSTDGSNSINYMEGFLYDFEVYTSDSGLTITNDADYESYMNDALNYAIYSWDFSDLDAYSSTERPCQESAVSYTDTSAYV